MIGGGLTFEPNAHRYTLDGVALASVTQVLHRAGIIRFDGIPEATLEVARWRGTLVHQAVHYYNEHDLDVDQFHQNFPQLAGYLQAWIAFCDQRHFTALLNEHRVASRRHGIAGTIDCLGLLDGRAVLLDFATGRPHDVAKNLQTAAYHGLALEWAADDAALADFFARFKTLRRYAVSLRANGTFTLDPYLDPADFRRFVVLNEAQKVVDRHRGERFDYSEVA